MSDAEDPQRLAETGASGLSSLFSAGQSDVATEAELNALASKLAPVLRAPSPSPPPLQLAKLVVGLGVGAALVGGGLYAFSARTALPPAPSVVPAQPSAVAISPVAPLAPPAESAAVLPPTALSAPMASVAPPAVVESEASLLERARRALAANPARALALAGEHGRRFPGGALSQEREVIAIAALRRLGRGAEADARAARFERNYPHSAHQHTIDGRDEH